MLPQLLYQLLYNLSSILIRFSVFPPRELTPPQMLEQEGAMTWFLISF